MTNANEILAASPTLRAAFDYTVGFCAREGITDPDLAMHFMDRAVRAFHAHLVESFTGEKGEALRERIARRVWVEIRTEAGLPID